MHPPRTLFARTGGALTIALLVFMALSVAVVLHYILLPVSKRAADDLATLTLLAPGPGLNCRPKPGRISGANCWNTTT